MAVIVVLLSWLFSSHCGPLNMVENDSFMSRSNLARKPTFLTWYSPFGLWQRPENCGPFSGMGLLAGSVTYVQPPTNRAPRRSNARASGSAILPKYDEYTILACSTSIFVRN